MHKRIAIIGECMLEMNLDSDCRSPDSGARLGAGLSFGGDTLNTALYMSRLGSSVEYITAVGDDHLSDWMIRQWQAEGIGCDLVKREANATPGLYLIETDSSGERTFHYWRDRAPARRLLENPATSRQLFDQLKTFDAVYLSGISLAILSPYGRECLFDFLADFRHGGGRVVYDGNYRPRLWGSETLTRTAYEQMYRLTDIALPTFEDEQALFADADGDGVLARIQSLGVSEVVLKMGADGCIVTEPQRAPQLVPAQRVVPVDTTAAGDSFNAGYLSCRLAGGSAEKSALAGHRLASTVIQHRGAIIANSAMPQSPEATTA